MKNLPLWMLGAGGLFLLIAPWAPESPLSGLEATTKIASSVVGLIVFLLVFGIFVFMKIYRRASANQAFVRTGLGGAMVILDNGSLIVPVLQDVIPVSLETMRLSVERRGPHALITMDNLRVDLSAEFYIKVQANREDILQAARSLGERSVTPGAVKELVQEKLVSALRTVAATKDLVELHCKRDEFAMAVQEIVKHDLSSNGLTLESVTISSLDQTDATSLIEGNVFDAQGLRKISEITQKARVERNNVERDAERAIAETNVNTKKQVLELQRQEREFASAQKMKVANFEAEREREINEFKIAQDEAIARREIEKQKQIGVSEVQRKLAMEQAEADKQIALVVKHREQEMTQIEKVKAVEVSLRAKEVAIAEKEQERAAAQAAQLAAEAQREAAKQEVMSVEARGAADRDAQKRLIAAKQQIEENRIREQTEADVLAYTEIKQADAVRQSAEMQYEAKLRLAEGDAQAAIRRAEGERAVKMVDVNVDIERVKIEQSRVAVERASLANKQEFEQAALGFELKKLQIDADRDARIKTAEALGKMLGTANMQIFGDPETMSKMMQQFMSAAGLGLAAEGLLKTLPPEAKAIASRLGDGLTDLLTTREKKPAVVDPLAASPPASNGHTPAEGDKLK
ncbi:MAG TPA: SPFH domain-containing protein [Pirellulales bacterium]